jgi:transketolase
MGLKKGAYVVSDVAAPDVLLIAAGSEVPTCQQAAKTLAESGIKARVVSMPSFELFEAQDKAYRDSVLPPSIKKRVVVEAGTSFGWCKYAGDDGIVIGIDRFGASGPYKVLAEKFGFTPENITAKTKEYLGR